MPRKASSKTKRILRRGRKKMCRNMRSNQKAVNRITKSSAGSIRDRLPN